MDLSIMQERKLNVGQEQMESQSNRPLSSHSTGQLGKPKLDVLFFVVWE